MSEEDSSLLSKKTWDRTLEPVTKIGYMDGASDGQATVYQKSFDVGYELGFSFGLEIGVKESTLSNKQKETTVTNGLMDSRKINCQMCLNAGKTEEIGNLYNMQREKNIKLLDSILPHSTVSSSSSKH